MTGWGWRASLSASLPALVLSLLPVTATASAPAPTSGQRADGVVVADPGSVSWAAIVGDHGSHVHDGRATLATEPEWQFVVHDLGDRVAVSMQRGLEYLDVDLHPPLGEALRAGEYRDLTHHAGDDRGGLRVSGSGAGCNAGTGDYTVHDVDLERSRLWVTFVYRCEGGAAITGEIQLNQPSQPDFTVAPTRLAWREEAVGAQSRPSPVTIVNTESTPLRVDAIDVTDGGSDFAVVHDTCGVLPAGGFCRAYVQAQPTALGVRPGALRVRTSRGDRVVALSTAGEPPDGRPVPPRAVRRHVEQPADDVPRVTRWRMEADPDSWVGNPGAPHELRARDLTYAWGRDTSFRIEGRIGGDPHWSAYFETDDDHLLLPRTTVTPVANTYPDGPYDTGKLRVSGKHRGCSVADRSFTVHEATYDLAGDLTGVALSFRYRCLDTETDGELRGSLAWNATCIPAMPDTRQEGRCLPPDQVRNPPKHRTGLTINRERLRNRVWIRGRLGDRLSLQPVSIVRRAPRGGVTTVGRTRTDRQGRYVVVLTRPAPGWYRARWSGNQWYRPALSPTVRLRGWAP